MKYIKDLKWKEGMSLKNFLDSLGSVGFQAAQMKRASEAIVRMRRNQANIFLSFTANMVTSGLRGFFAQLVKLGMVDVIVTTVGSIEEDIMKAKGEKFQMGKFSADDVALHEKGDNRVGNIIISNESYAKFEDILQPMFKKLYEKKKRYKVVELVKEIGLMLDDEDSILYQAAKNDVPIFCPGITDGAFGFHLFMFQEKHDDFVVDVVKDFKDLVTVTSFDDKKGIIALGGGISKHHAILGTLLSGGADYAVYITTSTQYSGSLSGATTQEAKSWGKIKDDSDAATVIGDATIIFPLVMMKSLEELSKQGLVKNG